MKNIQKDEELSNLLKTYRTPQAALDLEARIMHKIKMIEKEKGNSTNYLKYAWIFFGFGLISGSLITSVWFMPQKFIFNIPTERVVFALQITVVFFVLLFLNELMKTTLKHKKYKKTLEK